MLESWYRF